MNIKDKTILVLGGWGLVGNAVIHKLIPEKPKQIIVTSLKKEEAHDAVKTLTKEFPNMPKNYFIPWWGNVLVREQFKDADRVQLLENPETRKILMKDTMEELGSEILKNSSLYKLIKKHKPHIIIDCINTATGIAYQDVYTTYKRIKHKTANKPTTEDILAETERLLCTMYIPQLIRHIQILYNSMHEAKTEIYFKIGTSGTGGMGLNIPYTHSEEKPSRVLLSKSAVAGAHTLLLFLMARTPDTAITKEIKPTAAIAWKKIEFGSIRKRGKMIELVDVSLADAVELKDKFYFNPEKPFASSGKPLKSVYIDTGENGIFSRGEFEAISAQKQMEFVTPEEIAEDIIFEIKGGNTGHDVINALDNASLNPTYRAGYLQHFAVDKLATLEKQHNLKSVAFEMLGPPKLSKLLYELHLLSTVAQTMKGITSKSAAVLSKECTELITRDGELRNQILSIGIPILLPDGKRVLRGNEMKIPVRTGDEYLPVTKESIDLWAGDGWVDLRVSNIRQWQKRLNALMKEALSIPKNDTSSSHVRTVDYWNNFGEVSLGRVVSWLFIHEEKGSRIKD
ncbi:MAG: short-chain dehydrogenase [Ignavibacteriaceae bacterium]|nr:short-chain dehydrogenase [Ignavibacteriaceae bacterium]